MCAKPQSRRKGRISPDDDHRQLQELRRNRSVDMSDVDMSDNERPIKRSSAPVTRCGTANHRTTSRTPLRGAAQTWCKGAAAYDRAYHRRTRATRLAQKRLQHRRIAEWYRELKSETPCADCGGRFHHAAMSWDHLPGHEKLDDVSSLVSRHNRSLILAEIAKCELVCANCHAVRSYERRCSPTWLECCVWDAEVAGSNPATPTE